MRIRSQITILPPYDLDGEDYEKVAESLSNWVREWNQTRTIKLDQYGGIPLDRDSKEYAELREFFIARARRLPPRFVKWSEVVEAVYSEEELREFKILALNIKDEVGAGGNTYASVYETSSCEVCGFVRIVRQTRNLVADLTGASADVLLTRDFKEVLVADRVRTILMEAGVAGLAFRDVDYIGKKPPWPYFQLTTTNVLGPIIAPKVTFNQPCPGCGRAGIANDSQPERPDTWTEIKYLGPGPWNELHFPKASYQGWDLMRTKEGFGGPVLPGTTGPEYHWLLISQRLYRILRHQKVTGFYVQPAHLD